MPVPGSCGRPAEITVAEPVRRLRAAGHDESGQDGADTSLLEALPDYLADGLASERRGGSLARRTWAPPWPSAPPWRSTRRG